MAEKKTNRKPQSLNDSHYRLLQDLSAPPKPSSNPSGSDKDEKNSLRDLDDDHAILQFSGITNFDSSPEEKKPMKVKIEGRRRLCKVSSRNNDNTEGQVGVDEPKFANITDLDSPSPPPKKLSESNDKKDGNEIRDILNDLTSRFDILSIERKRVPKPVPVQLSENSSALIKEKDNEEKHEYASAGSSFSLTSDPSDSLSDLTNKVGSGVECVEYYDVEDDDLQSVVEDDNFVSSVGETKKQSEELKETESAPVDAAQSSGSSFDEEEGDLRSEFEGDSFVSRVYGTKKQSAGLGNCETRMVSDKLVSNIEEIEDEVDCAVISAKRMVKEASGRGSKFNKCDNSIAVDVFDDSVAEEEGSITLTGPKYNYKLPSKIAKMLYPHQRDGLRWLWSLHCQGKGGILGDDMGLGKTMQICGFLAGLFHSCLIKRALVVAPKTLLSHWIKELSIVGLSEKTREYYGTCAKTRQYELQYILQDKGVLLTTYDIVRNNSKSLQGDCKFHDEEAEDSITWDYMILDEGHLIKNPSTQRAKSLLEIPSGHRIIISGTPIQNNLKELWALFNFSCPELLGDKKWFKDRYEYAINRGNEKNASDREKRIGSTVAKELRERIQPYFLRRLKTDVFQDDGATKNVKLSKKNEIIVWLRLTNCQRQLYEAFLKSELVLSAFDGSPLAALTILKKICDHPLLLTKRAAEDVLEGMDSMLNPQDVALAEKLAMYVADATDRDDFQEKHDNVSCKISFILCLLDNLIPEGHKVLIFSQTRKMLNLIQELLLSEGYKFLRIDGTTKASDRVKIVDDFQEGLGAPIFLLTSQVGGLGLTLTKADRVIVVDPAWNPSTDNQSVDRAYRIGQTKDVVVYRLMTCGTVEEKIYRKQIFKGGLFKSATEHKEQIRYFSQQDLQELLSLPKQGFDVSVTQQQLHEEHDRQHIMDEYLKAHIKFLETKGIAGVSHHSLLFSKTGPVQVVEEEEEEMRKRGPAFVRNSSSSTSFECNVDGAEYAFNPKDVKLNKKSSAPGSADKLTEAGIIAAINQLSQTYANKAMVSRLPDKGEKLRKQIAELKSELYRIRMEEGTKKAIDLDDLSGELQRVLNV